MAQIHGNVLVGQLVAGEDTTTLPQHRPAAVSFSTHDSQFFTSDVANTAKVAFASDSFGAAAEGDETEPETEISPSDDDGFTSRSSAISFSGTDFGSFAEGVPSPSSAMDSSPPSSPLPRVNMPLHAKRDVSAHVPALWTFGGLFDGWWCCQSIVDEEIEVVQPKQSRQKTAHFGALDALEHGQSAAVGTRVLDVQDVEASPEYVLGAL